MSKPLSRVLPAILALSIGIAGTSALGNGSSNPVELAKYFNPFHKKKAYLNQSQDREIKKKSFKAGQSAFPSVVNRETGFFAIVGADKLNDENALEQLLGAENVNGISITVPWAQLEPSEDQFDWSMLDSVISQCAKHDKTLMFRVSTCGLDLPGSGDEHSSDTPKWVFDAGSKQVTYAGVDGKQHSMPLFWDTTYLAKWASFVKELGKHYDGNPAVHSIGITGGGFAGGTSILPNTNPYLSKDEKSVNQKVLEVLKKDHGMTPRQLVEHWKYVADLFPKRFTKSRLNFAINPPIHGRAGEDLLDEISDYLVYRYGARIFLTREHAHGKHGFDDYRVLLKFRNDTVTGLQVDPGLQGKDLDRLAKFSLDDGVSFIELPAGLIQSTEPAVKTALDKIAAHMGYQVIAQKTQLPTEVKSGESIKATFTFANIGNAAPMRPERQFDKDLARSYKVQIELRDASGKPVVQSQHTPERLTTTWLNGAPITWEEELRMPRLAPGEYSVYMSLVDPINKRNIKFLNALQDAKPQPVSVAELGKLTIAPAAEKVLESSKNEAAGN